MKQIALIVLTSLLVVGCSESEQHHYIVISNNYNDTCEIVAKYWRTERVETYSAKEGRKDTGKTVTLFESNNGTSQVYNVDKIIAKEISK